MRSVLCYYPRIYLYDYDSAVPSVRLPIAFSYTLHPNLLCPLSFVLLPLSLWCRIVRTLFSSSAECIRLAAIERHISEFIVLAIWVSLALGLGIS